MANKKKQKNYSHYYQKVRRSLIKSLKDRNMYNSKVDDYIIDRLVFQIQLADQAEQEIAVSGASQVTRTGYQQVSAGLTILEKANKQISQFLKQLNLSISDRYDAEKMAEANKPSLNRNRDRVTKKSESSNTKTVSIKDKYKKQSQ